MKKEIHISDTGMKRKGRTKFFTRILRSRETGIILVLLGICLILALIAPRFLMISNIANVARQMAVIAIISVGMTYVIVTGGIDLSVGSTVAFTGCISALLLVNGYPIIFCIIAGLFLGTLVGLTNGLLVVYVKLAPFIATLGTMGIARGLVLALTRGYPIQPFPKSFEMIGRGYLGIIPVPVLIMLGIVIIGHILLSRTRIGRYIYYIGSNETAARLSGLNVNGTLIFVYTVAGFLSGLASIVLISRLTSAQSNMGSGFELDAIAAVVIGGTSLSGGEGTVIGSLVGAALMGIIKNALILLGVNVYWQSVVIGLVIVFAVSIDAFRKNQFKINLREIIFRNNIRKETKVGNKKRKTLFIVIPVLLAILAIVGGYFLSNRPQQEDSEPAPAIAPTILPVDIDPEKQFGVDEAVTACDNELVINNVAVQEKSNQDFLIIDLEIANGSEDQVPINSFDLTVVDGEGDVHTDEAIGRTENPLGSHRLDPGLSAAGEVAFRVPKGDRQVKLIWQPGWCTGVVYIDLFDETN